MNIDDCTVLFVDDEVNVLRSIERSLIREPYSKLFASSVADALEKLKEHAIHVVVSDLNMPETGGEVFLAQLRDAYPDIVRLVLSGNADMRTVIDLVNENQIFRYISKPLDKPQELKSALRQALHFYQIRHERNALTDELQRWKDRLSKELLLAESVQQSILRTDPFFSKGVEIYFDYRSYEHVGGDIFDAFTLPDGTLFVYIGDVAGHGVGAAQVSSISKAIIESIANDFSQQGLHVICRELVHRFRHLVRRSELYATVLLAIIDPVKGKLDMLNCGHPNPLILNAKGEEKAISLTRGTIPVGWAAAQDMGLCESSVEHVVLEKGDSVVFYTDGLIECPGPDNKRLRPPSFLKPFFRSALSDEHVVQVAQTGIDQLMSAGYDLEKDDSSAVVIRFYPEAQPIMSTRTPVGMQTAHALSCEIAEKLRPFGWSDLLTQMVRLLVMEFATNIVKYSGLTDQDYYEFKATLRGSTLRLCFQDRGCEWDYMSRLEYGKKLHEMSENGRGLQIIDSLTCDRALFRRERTNTAVFLMDKNHIEQTVAEK